MPQLKYRIIERQFSANAIQKGVYIGDDKNGNPQYKWDMFLCGFIQSGKGTFFDRKRESDGQMQMVLEFLVEGEIKRQLILDFLK